MFDKLNLPPMSPESFRVDAEGRPQVYDCQRRRWFVLTPEEWVRQHFVRYMIQTLAIPPALMANEVSLSLNETDRRCDTVVYTRSLAPLCIVEYKRPTVEITSRVFDQIARYNSVLQAPWLIVSNGLRHFCCRFTGTGYRFLDHLPTYEEMLQAL